MQSYYAARASEYDRIYSKPERQTDLRAIERWLPPRFAKKRVIEVASGTGYWTQFLAPVAAHVLALDSAIETITIAETRVPRGKVSFLVGDAYTIGPSNMWLQSPDTSLKRTRSRAGHGTSTPSPRNPVRYAG
jgi:demethylmenaquinone methyltransferase/2-methoxy-6-polyprenyl-1,4-benzoquinol methylase